jgi:glycosyltransferase involved in cell wall biosynthesis
MKIIQILPEFNAGGVELCTLELATDLAKQGHESIVISNGGRMVGALEKAGVRHITMPVHRKSVSTFLQVRPLRKLLESERPHILHIGSRVPGWVAWLAWRRMNSTTRPHLVSTVHGFYSVNAYSSIMTKGERVIAVSKCIQDYIHTHYPKTPKQAIRIVPNGIDLGKFHPRFQADSEWLGKWNIAHPNLTGKQVLLLPGRITRLKGHEDFFRLIAALKRSGHPAHGLIAGDTHPKKRAYLDELKALVQTLGIHDDITFLGHRADILEIMSVSHIVCALSQQPESFGRTVLEALALGKPVVGYDCGGVAELLGALFPSGCVPMGDSERLVETTRAVLASNTKPSVVGEPFTQESMCRSTLAIYQELVG